MLLTAYQTTPEFRGSISRNMEGPHQRICAFCGSLFAMKAILSTSFLHRFRKRFLFRTALAAARFARIGAFCAKHANCFARISHLTPETTQIGFGLGGRKGEFRETHFRYPGADASGRSTAENQHWYKISRKHHKAPRMITTMPARNLVKFLRCSTFSSSAISICVQNKSGICLSADCL